MRAGNSTVIFNADAKADLGQVRLLTVPVEVSIRRCRFDDLPMLEWYSEDGHDTDVVLATYEAQSHGEAVMLVAEANGVVCGQAWIDLTRFALDCTGAIWAIHVTPCMRNVGIGTGLIAAAEETLRDMHFEHAELSVEKSNADAVRLYERLGYCRIPTTLSLDCAITSDPYPSWCRQINGFCASRCESSRIGQLTL